MSDCIFCKIVKKELKADFVYEDEQCVIFKDLYPKAKTHLLIVPMKHISSVAEMEDGDVGVMGHLMLQAKKIGDELGLEGYKLQINVGEAGGQEIFHVHVHLMSNTA